LDVCRLITHIQHVCHFLLGVVSIGSDVLQAAKDLDDHGLPVTNTHRLHTKLKTPHSKHPTQNTPGRRLYQREDLRGVRGVRGVCVQMWSGGEAGWHPPEGKEHDCLDAQELGEGLQQLKVMLQRVVEQNQAVHGPLHSVATTQSQHSRNTVGTQTQRTSRWVRKCPLFNVGTGMRTNRLGDVSDDCNVEVGMEG
jgi:hypothetical protein